MAFTLLQSIKIHHWLAPGQLSLMLAKRGSRQLKTVLTRTAAAAQADCSQFAQPAAYLQQQLCCRHLSCRAVDPTACSASEGIDGITEWSQQPLWRPHRQPARGFAATSYFSGGRSGDEPPHDAHYDEAAAAHDQTDAANELASAAGAAGGDSLGADRQPEPEEGDIETLLTQWEAAMDAKELDATQVVDRLVDSLADVQGIPSWQQILERGDEEEAAEREERRSREQQIMDEFAQKRVRTVDRFGRSYATGKRKCSIARVWIQEGDGTVSVNKRHMANYFTPLLRREDVLLPFEVTGTLGAFDVYSTVKGGGLTGQAQALRHGIARALQLFDPELRPVLKSAGLLTRDSRIVERKKPGKAKARKSFQWVKR